MLKITKERSITPECEAMLQEQVKKEAEAWAIYLSMASWCEMKRFEGSQKFLYAHAHEELEHMMKFFRYINIAGGHAKMPVVEKVPENFISLEDIFQKALGHEVMISNSIKDIWKHAITNGDPTTSQFLEKFMVEQREEEDVTRRAVAIFDIIDPKSDTGLDIYEADEHIGELSEEVHGKQPPLGPGSYGG